MKDFLKRCLAMLLVVSMVLSTGITTASATSSSSETPGTTADTENAIVLEPSEKTELLKNNDLITDGIKVILDEPGRFNMRHTDKIINIDNCRFFHKNSYLFQHN